MTCSRPGDDAPTQRALQDFILPFGRICYGCGLENEHGLKIRSYLEGDEAVMSWRPQSHHAAAPGVLSGGIIATLIDCHSAAMATAVLYSQEGRPLGDAPPVVVVTASLKVDYLRPTPLDSVVTLRARAEHVKGRKVVVISSLYAGDVLCASGAGVFIRLREPGGAG